MHPALRHALHHWTMSLHASISLNSGFRSMPLPDEIAVRPPPPLPQPPERGRSTGGRAGGALAYLEGRVTSTRSPCGRCGGLPASVRLPPPLSLCIALYLHAGVCARVPGPVVPVCRVLRQACRLVCHRSSIGMAHPPGSTLP